MARSKSEGKRSAILSAAIRVFAAHGLSAATSSISQAAGVAEGTLFTYFPTKDDLLNALYRDIKLSVAQVLMSGFAANKDTRSKLRHIWNSYLKWGVSNPDQRKVLSQLKVSDKLTDESKAVGNAPFIEIEVMAREAIAQQVIRDVPLEFISAAMEALAETTMGFMAAYPSHAAKYGNFGFDVLWNGIVNTSIFSVS